MPEAGVKFLPREEILTYEEIERFVRIAVRLGVAKVRITGGEPLRAKGSAATGAQAAAIPGIRISR